MLVIYAGGSFALVEFTAFMVDEFLLSPHWTRVVLTAVLLLLPSVAMLAWFHGRQGRDKVPLTEKIGIPANLALAATVLLLLFGGQDLGAATTAVSVETEDGETVERVVPKPEFRKRTALFPFDAGSGLDEDEAWLTYMAPLVLELDLAADDFFEPLLFGAFMQRLAELGFPALRDVPLSLKREIAAEFHSAFIVGGTIEGVEDRYRLTLTLHDAASGSQVSETVHEGPDFLALIDEMSETLADALEIPDRDEVADLAVRERLTGNDAAWEAFGQSYPKLLANPPDLDAAVAGLSAATAPDPTFTMAQYQLAVLLLSVNRPGEAIAPIQAAIDHLYRLPERLRFRVRSDYYFLMQQPEKAWAVIEMWVELHPEDPTALRNYLDVQLLRGDWEGMVGTLETLYRLNPAEHSLLRALAQAHEELGDEDRALAALAEYVEKFPEDYTGYFDLARIQRRQGDLDRARDYLERAIIIEPRMPELLGELASLDLITGRFESALSGYEAALESSRAPAQRAAALEGLREYYRFRGQMEEAIGMADAWLEEAHAWQAPMQVAQDPVLRHRPVSGRGPVRRRRGPVRGTAVSASTARERLPGPPLGDSHRARGRGRRGGPGRVPRRVRRDGSDGFRCAAPRTDRRPRADRGTRRKLRRGRRELPGCDGTGSRPQLPPPNRTGAAEGGPSGRGRRAVEGSAAPPPGRPADAPGDGPRAGSAR